jgi:hypothetical protein
LSCHIQEDPAEAHFLPWRSKVRGWPTCAPTATWCGLGAVSPDPAVPDRSTASPRRHDVSYLYKTGGLTRLVGRLEDRGLVERVQDAGDARSFQATLTKASARRLAEARATHDAVIEELVSSRLTARQVGALANTLGRVVDDGRGA